MKKYFIGIILSVFCISGMAAGTSSGKVSMLIINSSNYLFFEVGTKSGSPSCGNNNQWAVNLNTAIGKSFYAMLLTAQALNKTVYVFGTGTCTNWGDREDALYMYD